ncbi:MAG: hypothetical protein KF721_04765 [Ignavibacteriaceae bacterium]|nr:hypothetical protein [Ignavibacteriaceae bacterium]
MKLLFTFVIYEKPISSAPVVAFQAIFKYPFNKNNTLQFFLDYQPINYSFVPLNPPVKSDDRLIKVDGYSRKLGVIFSYYF